MHFDEGGEAPVQNTLALRHPRIFFGAHAERREYLRNVLNSRLTVRFDWFLNVRTNAIVSNILLSSRLDFWIVSHVSPLKCFGCCKHH